MTDHELERFKKLVAIDSNGCWIWTGSKNNKGYGYFGLKESNGWVNRLAHRVSYSHFKDDCSGMFVYHKCDVPACCNPDHLFLGTQKENMADMLSKGRSRSPTHCKRGHEFREGSYQLYRGCRFCLECRRISNAARYNRQNENKQLETNGEE